METLPPVSIISDDLEVNGFAWIESAAVNENGCVSLLFGYSLDIIQTGKAAFRSLAKSPVRVFERYYDAVLPAVFQKSGCEILGQIGESLLQGESLKLCQNLVLIVQQCYVSLADRLAALCPGDKNGITAGIFLLGGRETVTHVFLLGGNLTFLALNVVCTVIEGRELNLYSILAVVTLGWIVNPRGEYCLFLVLDCQTEPREIADRSSQQAFLNREPHSLAVKLFDKCPDLGAALRDILLFAGESLAVLLKGGSFVPQRAVLLRSALFAALQLLEFHGKQGLPGHERDGFSVILPDILFQLLFGAEIIPEPLDAGEFEESGIRVPSSEGLIQHVRVFFDCAWIPAVSEDK